MANMTDAQFQQLVATQAGPHVGMPLGANTENTADKTKGDITRDEVLKQELLRRIVYTSSGELSVGTELVPVQQMNQLGLAFDMPGETSADYPVSNDTQGERRYIEWTEFDIRLEKAIARYFVSDGAKLEGMIGPHMDAMARRTSEALARRKDENILGRLATAAPSENELNADEPWTDYDPDGTNNADIQEDLRRMWERILLEAPLSNLDVNNMAVVLPARAYVQLNRQELINNIQQQVRDHLAGTFNFTFYPHKVGMHHDDRSLELHGVNLQDKVIMLIPGEDTAVHGELSQQAAAAANVPLVEGPVREAQKGEDYFITQWFETNVMEFEQYGPGKNPRIVVMDGVNHMADEDHAAIEAQ